MTDNDRAENSGDYDLQLKKFLSKITLLASLEPRKDYLYPVMRCVPFNDLDVALDIAILRSQGKTER